MKWLGNLITGLIGAVLAAIALAFFQPIVEAVSPDPPLRATIEASRWVEKPKKARAERTLINNNPSLEKLYHQVWMNPEQNKFLAILLSNEGKETVKDMRIRIEDENERPTAMIVSNDGLDRNVIVEKSYFLLPDLRPGEQIRIYLWAQTAFPRELLPHNLKIFSSAGPFEITYAQPEERQYFIRKSAVYDFVDKWIGTIFVTLFLALAIALFLSMALHLKYFKRLLADQVFYAEEKARYETDPVKFTPNM